jgi:hypothetical protein
MAEKVEQTEDLLPLKRKWEEDSVPLPIRKRVKMIGQPITSPLIGFESFVKIDQWADESCQILADILVERGSGTFDVGRVIAAIDEFKHVKNIAKDALLLK